MANIECPSCKAVISEDGEKVIKRSPRIKRLDDLIDSEKAMSARIEALEKKLEKGGSGGKEKEDPDDDW